MDLTIGLHPITGEAIVFNDVKFLHDTIVDWYNLIDPRSGGISFCVNEMINEIEQEPPEPTSERFRIHRDGSVNRHDLARISTVHFNPSIYLIVIPRVMYEEYKNRYGTDHLFPVFG